MCWKMSIDLSRPTVSSMGNLDPYDGLVTCTLLQQAAVGLALGSGPEGQGVDTKGLDQGTGRAKVLQEEMAKFQAMVDARYHRYGPVPGKSRFKSSWSCICTTRTFMSGLSMDHAVTTHVGSPACPPTSKPLSNTTCYQTLWCCPCIVLLQLLL